MLPKLIPLLLGSMLCGLACQARKEVPATLGRSREQFGDLYRYSEEGGDWICIQTSSPPTIMFFPAGRADARYYLKEMSGDDALLVLVRKEQGELKRGWKVWLKSKRPPKLDDVKGTLATFLSRRGWDLAPALKNKAIARDIGLVGGYAGYRTDTVAGSLYAGFLQPDGTLLTAKDPSPYIVDKSNDDPWPSIGMDYPITEWEQEYVRQR